ncbi:MAG TPA: GxxExxY protein [Saprospiraceae bacterium]|nr:GxxExxY protein [Saprospiraceae bacterium]
MKYEEITHKIIGCAMKVHSAIGSGFQEVVYQRALEVEMERQKLSFVREMEMNVIYNNVEVGKRRVDFFVEQVIMLELKALVKLDDLHITQIMNYCQVFNFPFGLLINFGGRSLEFKRVYNLNHTDNWDLVK